MSSSAPKRARALYLRDTVERRIKRFTERMDPEAVRASRDFHLRHWLAMAKEAIERDHAAAYYGGLQPNVEAAVAEHPGDDLPTDLQRAVMADLAFMEGHLEAFREILRRLEPPQHERC
jgi:hypothetical protein